MLGIKFVRRFTTSSLKKTKLKITKLVKQYEPKFKKIPINRLNEYEKAFGFTEISRVGSQIFSCKLGYFFEDLLNISDNFTKNSSGWNYGLMDGKDECTYYEVKSRHNTMNQGNAFNIIKPRLIKSIEEDKDFYLLVMMDEDKRNIASSSKTGRNIPLHEGCGLKKIKEIKGYNTERHRWLSEDFVYERFFPGYSEEIKTHVLKELSKIRF